MPRSAALCSPRQARAAPRPPNILFIMADQLAACRLGCYGSGVPSTPVLDGLARAGLRFDRCYATHPVCAPSRASFLTGRSACVHGIIGNNFALAGDLPTYAQVLRDHGYRTAGFGKFHQTPMHRPAPRAAQFLGFDEAVVTQDPKWGPWLEWIEAAHPEQFRTALAMCWPRWPCLPYPPLREAAAAARRRIIEPLREASGWQSMYPSPLPAELHDTVFITDQAQAFIRRQVAARPDQPFLCHVSYVDPHDPYDPPQPYASRFAADEMPAVLPAEWLGQGYRLLEEAQRIGGFHRVCDRPQVVRALHALYHGSLSLIDDQIARLVSCLRETGLWDDTIVVFTTDHGEMLGDHGLVTKGVMHYDAGIRCPLVVAGGGVTAAGATARLTGTLDFFPTFCDWAGIPAGDRPPLEGRSFAPVCAGAADADPWRELSVSFRSVETVVTDDGWRLTRYTDEGTGHLFDLAADPEEQRNLYTDAGLRDRRGALLERLADAATRPHRTPHYRNLPLIGGRKVPIVADEMLPGLPHYRMPASPEL